MDHITQLYQNRAKVLQEEVTRLEALLEAVKDIELGKTEEVPVDRSRSLSAPVDVNAKKKKDEDEQEAKLAKEKYPIGAPIVSALKSTGEAIGNVGDVLDNPWIKYGIGIPLGYSLASTRIKPGAPADKAGSSIFYTHQWTTGVNPYTGEVDTSFSRAVPKPAPKPWLRGSLADFIISKRGKMAGKEQEAQSLRDIETAKIAAADKEAALEKIQKNLISRTAQNIKPGEVGPSGEILRDPNLKIGEKGSMQDAGIDIVRERVKAATETESGVKGGRLTVGAEKMLRQKISPSLRSIGAITPEDIEAAGQGVKDIAMTGKEVGKRTKDLARGALGVAGKGLKIVDAITDPLSAAGEAIGLSSLSAVAPEVVGGLAMAPFAIGAFTSEAGKGSDIVAPSEAEIKVRQEWAKEQRKQQGLAPVDSITSPISAVDAASLGAVTVSQQDRAKLERQAMGAKTSTPNLDRIQKQREMLKLLQSGPRMFGGGVK